MPGSQRKREVRKEGPDSARASPLDFWNFGNKADFLCLYLLHLIERVKDTGDFVRQESNKSQGSFSSAFKGERRKGPNMELDFTSECEPSPLSSVAIWHSVLHGISLK